jgi:uncharacterized integral membrane protein
LRLLKAVVFLGLVVLGVLFAASNQTSATVRFYSFFSATYPLYLVLFACFAAGTLCAILFVMASDSPGKDEKRLASQRDRLKEDLRRASAAPGRR